MICDYILTHKGNVYKFNSEQELDTFIRENIDEFVDRDTLDIRYSKSANDIIADLETINQEASQRLAKDRQKAVEAYRQAQLKGKEFVAAEIEEDYKDGYTSVLNYIGATFVKPLSKINYADQMKVKFKANPNLLQTYLPELSNIDVNTLSLEQQAIYAQKAIDNTFQFWDYLQDVGRGLHYIMDQMFNEKTLKYERLDIDVIRDELRNNTKLTNQPGLTVEGISDEAFNQYIKDLRALKRQILNKQPGKTPKIFTEFVIDGETNLNEKIRGKIDLMVVYDDGTVDVYDLKISSKNDQLWDRDKDATFNYQLGFYRRMLEAKGIPHSKINLKIIPVLASEFKRSGQGSSIGSLSLQEVIPRFPDANQWNQINTRINVDKVTLETPIKQSVEKKLTSFFPVTMFTDSIQTSSREQLKRQLVTKNSEGKFIFKDQLNDGQPLVANTEEDLDILFTNYFQRLAEYQQEYVTNITNSLSNELEKLNISEKKFRKDFSDRTLNVLPNRRSNRVNAFMDSNLEAYRTELGWKVLKSDDFSNMGIVVLINTINHKIDVLSITNNDIFAKVDLPEGSTILGNFYSDASIETRDNNMFGTVGNVEVMKMLAVVDEISNNPEFAGYRLNIVKAINPLATKSMHQFDIEKALENYRILNKKSGFNTNPIRVVDAYERAMAAYGNIITFTDKTKLARIKDEVNFDIADSEIVKDVKLNNLIELQTNLRDKFFYEGAATNEDSLESYLYRTVNLAIAQLSGTEMDLFNTDAWSKYGAKNLVADFKNRMTLNGTDLNTLDTIPIIKPIANLLNQANSNIRIKYKNYKGPDRTKTDAFYKTQLSLSINKVANLYTNTFKSFLDTSEYGKKNFMVKNPWTDTTLSNAQKEYLIYWLEDLNKHRFPDMTEVQRMEYIDNGKFFEIPLLRASWTSKVSNGKNFLQANVEDFGLDIMNPKFGLDDDTSIYVKDNQELSNMYNVFKAQEDDNFRANELAKGNPEQRFEVNLEHVKDTYVFSQIRETEYNKIIPRINAGITSLQTVTYLTGKPSKEILEFITDYINSAVYNESLIDDNAKAFYKLASVLKNTASMAILGFNYVSGIKETVTGLHTLYSKAVANSLFDKDKIGLKDMDKAYRYVWTDALKQVNNITLLEHLNEIYGYSNMDVNALVEKENYNRADAFRFKSHMYWSNRAPDFLHRMTILVGYLVKYGALDAYTIDGDDVTYDWKKDKRFEVFAKNDTSNPEYNNQRALYNAMLEQFIRENRQIKDKDTGEWRPLTMNDALPDAFTQKEAQRGKQEAETLFGYMDHDTKSLIYKRGIGTIIGQFQTYITAKKNQYFLKRGVYNDGKWVHKQDTEGNKLYWEFYEEDGKTHRRLTTEVTPDPYWDWEGKVMEGIFWSLFDMFNVTNPANFKQAWADPVKRRNLLFALEDAALIALILWICSEFTSDEPIHQQDYLNRLAYKVIWNVKGDIDPFEIFFGAVDFRFVAYDFWGGAFKDAWSVVMGDKDATSFLTNNFSFLRPSKKEIREIINGEE